jgi:hypothetical protein
VLNTALFSSEKASWNTPENIVRLVRALGPVVLDPCSNADSIVGAASFYDGSSLEMCGLSNSWAVGDGLVYVNPPYGAEIAKWLQKCVTEAENGVEIVALLPARTDTKWWQDYVTKATCVLFWKGRLQFLGAASSAPFPSAIVYWGCAPDQFAAVFGNYGWVVRGMEIAQ